MSYLIGGVLLIASIFLFVQQKSSPSCYNNVDVPTFKNITKEQKDVVILDVRTAEEFRSGSIPKAINLDVNQANFASELQKLDKTKTYLVYCRSGMRSAKACDIMCKLEFENIHNLLGGFNGWS